MTEPHTVNTCDIERSESAAPRTAAIDRKTAETEIHLRLTIEGRGRYTVSTGIRFFDHMLELFTRHGAFDLEIAIAVEFKVERAVAGEELEHVIEEADTGMHFVVSAAFDGELQRNFGFGGFAIDRALAFLTGLGFHCAFHPISFNDAAIAATA